MILVAATAYNEIKYIKHFVDFYRKQGCELLVLDNYSTDGTYEWLLENNVKTSRVDTKGTFHLGILQAALLNRINKIAPDWLIYCGVDLYYYFEGSIEDEIRKAKTKNYNIIEVDHLDGYNTGETFQMPFQDTYYYVTICKNPLQMIARWHPHFRFAGDKIRLLNNESVYKSQGFLINYGMCKPKAEREETYNRRIKAWKVGELKGHGTHYKPAHDRQWIWRKEELVDIRETRYYSLMK